MDEEEKSVEKDPELDLVVVISSIQVMRTQKGSQKGHRKRMYTHSYRRTGSQYYARFLFPISQQQLLNDEKNPKAKMMDH
jgi:hypothetical protein